MTSLELDALQRAVAAENAIVYGYGLVGSHLTGSAEAYADASLQAHLARQSQLEAMIRAAGATPVAASPAYRSPIAVTNATSAARLGAYLEEAAEGAAWDLVSTAAPSSDVRRLAVAWLSDATSRATRWRGGLPDAFPGRPPRST